MERVWLSAGHERQPDSDEARSLPLHQGPPFLPPTSQQIQSDARLPWGECGCARVTMGERASTLAAECRKGLERERRGREVDLRTC